MQKGVNPQDGDEELAGQVKLLLHTQQPFARRCSAASYKTVHGFVPGLIIVRVAPFRRPLDFVHQQLRRHRAIVMAK